MQERVYFHNLDKIRFYAALAIFVGHGTQAFTGYFFHPASDLGKLIVTQIVANAPLGVELFFFISGFLITYILLKEKQLTGKIAIGKFFIRRAIRIWPLYFLLIAITPLLISWLKFDQPAYIPNLLFYGNFDIIQNGASYPFTHFWSIAIEEQFYVVWPFIIAFIPMRRLWIVFTGLIVVSIGFRYQAMFNENVYYTIYYHTFSRMDTLVIGAFAALMIFKYKWKIAIRPFAIVVLMVFFVLLICFTKSNFLDSTITVLFKKYIYLLTLVPITLYFIFKPKPEIEGRWSRATSYLGKSSYGLYMIHNMLIPVIVYKIMINNGLTFGWVFWMIYAGCTTITVVVIFELYEKPLLKLKRFFTVVKTRQF